MLSSLRCQKTRIVRSLTNARPIAIHSRNVIPSAIRSYAIGIRTEAESDLYEKEWKGMMNIAAAEAVEDNGPRQLQSPKNLDNEVDERERKKARAAYHAHLELRTFSNPTNMVRHVSRHLERGEYDVAYEIVKQAGAKLRSVPGWNLLIDYWMNKGHIDDAFKVYNNMKKRGVQPDSHTIMRLYIGLARNSHFPTAVTRAVHVHESLYRENSPVKPQTRLTNACLKVVAAAGNIEEVWRVLDGMALEGENSPDLITYTTLFSVLRNFTPEADIEDTVSSAKRAFAGLLMKWKKNKLQLDEAVVLSFCRLLCRSKDKVNRITANEVISAFYEDVPRFDTITVYNSTPETHPTKHMYLMGMENPPHFQKWKANKAVYTILLEVLNRHCRKAVEKCWSHIHANAHIKPDFEMYLQFLSAFKLVRAHHRTIAILEEIVHKFPEDKFRLRMAFHRAMGSVGTPGRSSGFEAAKRVFKLSLEHTPKHFASRYDPVLIRIFLNNAQYFSKRQELRKAIEMVRDVEFPLENNSLLNELPAIKVLHPRMYKDMKVKLRELADQLFSTVDKALAKAREWKGGMKKERKELEDYAQYFSRKIDRCFREIESGERTADEELIEKLRPVWSPVVTMMNPGGTIVRKVPVGDNTPDQAKVWRDYGRPMDRKSKEEKSRKEKELTREPVVGGAAKARREKLSNLTNERW